MEQNRNMEQGGTAAAVPTEKKNENRKREVSGKDAQIIRAFLESVGIYEAGRLAREHRHRRRQGVGRQYFSG